MSDSARPLSAPSALTEPTRRVNGLFMATMALANVGIMLAFLTPIQNLIPRMATEVAGDGGKEAATGVILGIGVIGSVIGNPLAGALSDRTTSRWGRRRPWMLGGALLGAVGLFLLGTQTTVLGLTIVWLIVQFAVNAAYAGLTATIPDQVPVEQRGVASGWVGLAQTLGVVIGVALVTLLILELQPGTNAVAVLLVLCVVPFILVLKDPRITPSDREPFRLWPFVREFWISPKDYPDFAWAWAARFLVSLGIAMATALLLFYIQDELGFSEDESGPRQTTLIGLYALGTMVTAVIGGAISDRSGKRKVFVVISTIVIAVAACMLAFASSFNLAMAAAVILGCGYGWYLAVDQALITQVLPNAVDRARDLGVINIANSLPQVLATPLAALIVTSLGGYPVLYVVTAIITLFGALAVLPIRSVP